MPAAGLIIGGIASGIGGALSARAGNQSSLIGPIPAPKPINADLNSLYKSLVGGPSGLGATSAGTIQSMAATGMPTDVTANFSALVDANRRMRSESQANITEQFGAKGLRFGSTLGTALTDFNTQSDKDLLATLSNYLFQTQENAANRQLQAATIGFGDFSQNANALFQEYVPKVGQQSPTGSALSSVGNLATLFSMLKMFGGK